MAQDIRLDRNLGRCCRWSNRKVTQQGRGQAKHSQSRESSNDQVCRLQATGQVVQLIKASGQACDRIAVSLNQLAPQLEAHASDPVTFASLIAQYNTRMLIDDREMGLAVYELNLAGAHDTALRPTLYKWGKIHAQICEKAFARLGSKDPAADYAFLLHAVGGLIVAELSLPRKDFENRVFRPAIERLIFSIAGLAPRS